MNRILFMAFLVVCSVQQAVAQTWNTIGLGISTGKVRFTTTAIDRRGTLYVAYKDAGVSGKAMVQKYYEGSWVIVGGTAVSDSSATDVNIAIDNTGTPWVAYSDSSHAARTTVKKFSGGSWNLVGTAAISAGASMYNSIAFDKYGTPYVAFTDLGASGNPVVMTFNGSYWATFGPTIVASGAGWTSIAVDTFNQVYVAYTQGTGLYEKRYNGTAWQEVSWGSNPPSSGSAEYISFAVNSGGDSYISFEDMANSEKLTVSKFTNNWNSLYDPGFTTNAVKYTGLALDKNSVPFVVYQDYANSQKATVEKFTGGSWVVVGSAGISSSEADYTSIAIDSNGVPYIAYEDFGYFNRLTVKKFGSSIAPVTGVDNICSGSSTTFSDVDTGGIWSTSNALVATVDSISGVVTGTGFGIATITYSVDTLYSIKTITVSVGLSAGSISAPSGTTVCVQHIIGLYDSMNHGIWTATNANATVFGGGVQGVTAGTDTIVYTVSNVCGSVSTSIPVYVTGTAPSAVISTFAGNGTASYSGDLGPATAAEMDWPYCITTDKYGNVYIADSYNNRIRKINSAGIISTFAGLGSATFSGDGGGSHYGRYR